MRAKRAPDLLVVGGENQRATQVGIGACSREYLRERWKGEALGISVELGHRLKALIGANLILNSIQICYAT